MNMDLQTVYERIQNSKSPIEEVGTIILETGGQWDPAEAAGRSSKAHYDTSPPNPRCWYRSCSGS